MQLKILQLNIWAGTHFSAIKTFLNENDFDILCFQEVSGPRDSGNVHVSINTFDELQQILGSTHNARLVKSGSFMPNPPVSYEGNAIFYKKTFSLLEEHVIWLNRHEDPFPQDGNLQTLGRTGLTVTLSHNNQTFHIVTAHLAWAPTNKEQPHQRQQNLKLIEFIKQLKYPWTLTGDFNISPENQTILDLEKLGRNLIKENHIENTIDAVNHVSWEKIKPGFPVDYIFVSKDIEVKEFGVLKDVHLSDHLGITATLNI